TDNALGEALGQFYVQKAFTPQTKARAQAMVRNLIAALRQDLSTLSWMSDVTRQRAIGKLDAFLSKIGYQDTWRNYEARDIDQGARFDAEGNLVDWWTPADFKNFKSRTDCVVNQFSSYEAEPGLHLKGELVVGESVADLGGLTISYAAFKEATKNKPQKTIDGFTPEQRFFLAWAQVWASNIRAEEARRRVTIDPH